MELVTFIAPSMVSSCDPQPYWEHWAGCQSPVPGARGTWASSGWGPRAMVGGGLGIAACDFLMFFPPFPTY